MRFIYKETMPDDKVLADIIKCITSKDYKELRSLVPKEQAKRIHARRDDLSPEDHKKVDRFYMPYVMLPAMAKASKRVSEMTSPWNDPALLNLRVNI